MELPQEKQLEADIAQLISIMQTQVRHLPIKRTFDILFSLFALTLSLPLLLCIALIIRFSSRGNIFYSHQRIGRGGKLFKCYKFRTMYPDADARLEALLEENPLLKAEWEKARKLKQDPRVLPIGQFLRKSSLDELPQFWNVLKGDLSVVGPRPVVKEELLHFYRDKAPKILSMRPGLTCIWQVSGRNDTSYQKRVQLDEDYIDNHSLFLDIKLICKTIPSMIASKGAY